jgi:hypothetical protein
MSDMLFVTNRNEFHHTDRYDGKDYQFPPGQKVMLSAEAARHMFGLGEADKTNVMHRKGWAFKYDPDTKTFIEDRDAVQKLKNFQFTRAVLVETPAVEQPVEEK